MPGKACLAAIALTVTATPLFADVTAKNVWADLQRYAGHSGATLEAATQSQTGDTLTLSGVTFRLNTTDGTLVGQLGEFVLVENRNGTVDIIVPDTYALAMDVVDDSTDVSGTLAMTIRQAGLEMAASGSDAETLYRYVAPSVSAEIEQLIIDDEEIGIAGTVQLSSLNGEYEMRDGDPVGVRSQFAAGTLNASADVTAPEGTDGPDDIKINLSVDTLQSTSSGTMGDFSAMLGLAEMIDRGMSTDGNFSYQTSTLDVTGTDEDAGDFAMAMATGAGMVAVTLGEEGVHYRGETQDVTMQVAGAQIPVPNASVEMDAYEWAVRMPIGVSDAAEDLALSMQVMGLSLSDMVWSLFDPQAVLPRDPATLIIDIVGKGNWLIDITDPDIANQPIAQMPGQLETLKLNQLRLDLAGAELTGQGDFTFDNSAGPMRPPVPSGEIDLQLVGANALIDGLVAMGLLPEDQAMGARMMLGIFAIPSGADTLNSKIEFTPSGGIIANGQAIR